MANRQDQMGPIKSQIRGCMERHGVKFGGRSGLESDADMVSEAGLDVSMSG